MLRRMSSRRSEMKKKLYIKTLEEKVQRLAYQAAYLSAQVTLLQVKRHHCSDWKLKLSSLFIIFCVVNSLLFILVYLWMTITIFEKFFFFVEQTDNSSLEFEIKCLKLHADNTKQETELRDGNGYS